MAETVFLVVGLGNPGPKYENTPHNIGFEIVDALASRWGVAFSKKFDGFFGDGKGPEGKGLGQQRVLLLKPQTYMNLSGRSVAQAASFYKIALETHLLVLSDDIDLPPGQLRLRHSGSCGGHNGLRSVEDSLGTNAFPRMRVGVGRGTPIPADQWVLKKNSGEQRKLFDDAIIRAVDGVELLLRDGVEKAMNTVNRKIEEKA